MKSHYFKKIKSQKTFDTIPIISNLVLIVLSAAFISWTVRFFTSTIETDSLRENRFIIMEWNLLKELKMQTDKQLSEKDREIKILRQRYRKLEQSKAFDPERREMEMQLKKLEEERAELIRHAGKTRIEDEEGPDIPVDGMDTTVDPSELTKLLLVRIAALEAKLEEERLTATAREKELRESAASNEDVRTTEASERRVAKARKEVLIAYDELRRKKQVLEGRDRLDIDELNTWTLLRALASTQAIKTEYPDLLSSIERFFDAYGRQKFIDGQKEAYAAAIRIFELLIETLNKN